MLGFCLRNDMLFEHIGYITAEAAAPSLIIVLNDFKRAWDAYAKDAKSEKGDECQCRNNRVKHISSNRTNKNTHTTQTNTTDIKKRFLERSSGP